MMAALQMDSQSVTEVMARRLLARSLRCAGLLTWRARRNAQKDWARELFLLRWVRTVRPGTPAPRAQLLHARAL
jgi:hypothetical protein